MGIVSNLLSFVHYFGYSFPSYAISRVEFFKKPFMSFCKQLMEILNRAGLGSLATLIEKSLCVSDLALLK